MNAAQAALHVLGEPGWRLLLDAASALERAGGDPLRAAAHLRSARNDAAPPHRAAALELTSEGRRLAAKAGLPGERLLAVRGAVEQASAGRVASWHASRVPAASRVVEIGCGCGVDSIALAHVARNLIATDTDPVRAACAHVNLAAFGLSSARALPEDGLAVLAGEGSAADVVFADPDRRPLGVRVLDPSQWAPPLADVLAAAAGRTVLVKCAPSIDPEAAGPGARVSFVSHEGECVEALIERGPSVPEGVVAVQLPSDGPAVELSGDRGQAPEGPVGAVICVPDPAAVRGRLLAELCRRHGLVLPDARIALLTGDAAPESSWLRPYDALAVTSISRVAEELRSRGASAVRVHVRGLAASPSDLERSWRGGLDPRGRGPELDVFATRIADRPSAIVARPRR